MAESLLSDAKVRNASRARDGAYLSDGGGLRIRLLDPSAKHPKGARLAEYHFKLKDAEGDYRNGAIHLGTIGEPHTDAKGVTRPFTLADARDARDAARELVGRGIDPRHARKLADAEAAETQRQRLLELEGRRTVRDAFKRWKELYLSAHRKDGGQFVEDLFERHVFPTLGDVPLEALRRQQVTDVLDRLTADGRRRTANMALSLLRQFVRWCSLRDWIDRDPTLALSKAVVGGKEKARERVLSQFEIVALRDALPASKLPERLQHALWLILATGCRVGELSGARAADFDLEARHWHIPETKNGEPHDVHLSDFAAKHAAVLLKLRDKSPYLLPGRVGPEGPVPINDKFISKAVHDRQRAKPLKGRTKHGAGSLVLSGGAWTPHDLRRTMATRMRELGVSSDVIERCLNHKPQGIVAVYQRGELLAERKAAFEAWGRELERLMALDVSNVAELTRAAA